MLTINSFHKGISSSPYVQDGAYSKSANLDISGQLGIARINYKPVKATENTAVDELAGSFTFGGTAPYFATLNNSVYSITVPAYPATDTVYKIGDNKGNFCQFWNNYLIALRYTTANCYSGTWSILSGTLENTAHHYIFYSKADKRLWFANGRYVGYLKEQSGKTFNPGASDTYEINGQAFTLPYEYKAYSISELGKWLVICANYEDNNYLRTAYFLWDRSATTADAIYIVEEPDITTPLAHGENIYLTGGKEGNIYQLTTGGIQHYAQLPFDYDKNRADLSYFHRNQLAWWNGGLMVGVGSTGATRITPAGIYSIRNGKVNCDFLISSQEDGTNAEVLIGGIMPIDSDTLIWSWRTESGSKSYGIDIVKTKNDRTTSYGTYLESLFYSVGTKSNPKTFERVEVVLSRPLQTGEGVRISYRRNVNDSWTVLDTQDYSTYGARSSLDMPAISNIQNIQIKCELTTGSASANTPFLLAINLVD